MSWENRLLILHDALKRRSSPKDWDVVFTGEIILDPLREGMIYQRPGTKILRVQYDFCRTANGNNPDQPLWLRCTSDLLSQHDPNKVIGTWEIAALLLTRSKQDNGQEICEGVYEGLSLVGDKFVKRNDDNIWFADFAGISCYIKHENLARNILRQILPISIREIPIGIRPYVTLSDPGNAEEGKISLGREIEIFVAWAKAETNFLPQMSSEFETLSGKESSSGLRSDARRAPSWPAYNAA